ncbi:MAG: enoyl-CoA hydratase/isomerase family protein [Nitrospinaceae bacterium]
MREVFSGQYVAAATREYRGRKGVVVKVENPESKVETVSPQVLNEFHQTLDAVGAEGDAGFCIFHGGWGKIHAGAELSLFHEDIDSQRVHDYLWAGARLDLKIKELSRAKQTVSIMHGDRYGGSVEWPLMAQYCVCTGETSIRFSEVNIGLIPGWNGILNLMLRSGSQNAFYLAATGDKIHAPEMLAAGLVSGIFPQASILENVLDMIVEGTLKPRDRVRELVDPEKLEEAIKSRSDAKRYRSLLEDITRHQESLGDPKSPETKSSLNKLVQRRLKDLGRPIAPRALAAVSQLVRENEPIDWENKEGMQSMTERETQWCFDLMHTQDRKTGVRSILTDNPLERIPIFAGC